MNLKEVDVINTELAEDMSDDYYAHDPITESAFKYKVRYPNYAAEYPVITVIDNNSGRVSKSGSKTVQNFKTPSSEVNVTVTKTPKTNTVIFTEAERKEIKNDLKEAVTKIKNIENNIENKILGLPKKTFWIGVIALVVIGGIIITKK